MIAASSEVATILNVPNNIFVDVKDDVQLNFCNPKTELKPFVELIDDEEVTLKIHKNKVILDNNVKLHFDDPSVVSVFNSDGPQDNIEYFVSFDINDEFINKFNKIKKIGNRFGKIYLTVKDKVLYIETMDKTNTYSNGISFDICETDNNDLTMCFDYQIFVHMMNVIDKNFKMKLSYIEEKEGGMIYTFNDEEKYFLMSKVE
ncbi:MAG: hypothetical protein ACOCZ5_02285 [bacterium]